MRILLLFILLFTLKAEAQQTNIEFGKIKELVYSCTFSKKSDLKDWKMEGSGIAKIKRGKLELYSEYHKAISKKMLNGDLVFDEQNKTWYQNTVNLLSQKKEGINHKKYYRKGIFRGGHFVFWNKTLSPENYVIEFDFKSRVPLPLNMIMFSAIGKNGESVFDESLKLRYGVADQYTRGDINNYRISFLAPERKTVNMRKCPGRILVATGIDTSIEAPTSQHHMKVVKWKNKIEFWIDNKIVLKYTDKDNCLGAGYTALRLMVPARAYYDNYNIYKLSLKK